jgi:hypothetical protein
MSNKKESLDKREVRRRLALLALAAEGQKEAAGTCPDPEMFAAFLEGDFEAPERQAVMSHISRCESCYQHWFELSRELEQAGQGAPTAGSARKRRRWLSGAGSIGAIALGVMLFLSLDYRGTEQHPVGRDAPETAPQIVSPSVRMKMDENHGAAEEENSVIRAQSPAETEYSARQPVQPKGAAEPAVDAERPEKQKSEGGGKESLQEVRLPATLDVDRVQPAEKRQRAALALSDQLSATAADAGDLMDLVSELCENDKEAEQPADKSWEHKLQILLDRGRVLLEPGNVQEQERSQVEQVMAIIEGEIDAAGVDRVQLCRRLASYLRSVQPER